MLLRAICYAIAQYWMSACDINGLMPKANAFDLANPRQSDLKRTERHRSLLGRGEDTNRSDYEQSEPTETRPTTARRPEQARPTAGRRLAKARPAAGTARSGRTAGRTAEARTAEARTAERPTLNFF